MKKQKLRLGVVGLGLIWQHVHEKALREMADYYQIAAFCAKSNETKDKIEQQYSGIPFYFDYDALLSSSEIDAVLILTPLEMNGSFAIAALKANKIVIVEKPICMKSKEIDDIIRLQQETKLPLFVLEQETYRPVLDELKTIINSGRVGQIVYFDIISHFTMKEDIPLGGYEQTLWRQQANFPLGTLFDGGIHDIARVSYLFGNPDELYATGVKLRDTFGDYDHIAISFHYANKHLSGTLSHGSLMPSNSSFKLYATEATITISSDSLNIVYRDNREEKIDCAIGGSVFMWNEIKTALQQGDMTRYTINNAIADVKTLLAVERSLVDDSVVKL